jgi:hypothetical protein
MMAAQPRPLLRPLIMTNNKQSLAAHNLESSNVVGWLCEEEGTSNLAINRPTDP